MNMQGNKHVRHSGLVTIVLVWGVLLTYHYSAVSTKSPETSGSIIRSVESKNHRNDETVDLDRIVIIAGIGVTMIGVGHHLISHDKYNEKKVRPHKI